MTGWNTQPTMHGRNNCLNLGPDNFKLLQADWNTQSPKFSISPTIISMLRFDSNETITVIYAGK